jgi:hypothetical protein
MDELFANALAAGRLARDSSLDLPPPPILPMPVEAPPPRATNVANAYQVQITGEDVKIYNFAMAHLRTIGGVQSATPQQINGSGTSYVLVMYRGSIAQLAAALSGRGWAVDYAGTVVRVRANSGSPPPLPPPPAPAQPAPQPQPPSSPPGEPQ